MRNPEETLGMMLGIAFLAVAFFLALDIARAVIIACWRDAMEGLGKLRTWWQNRRPARGWQPGDHPRGPRPWLGIRRPR